MTSSVRNLRPIWSFVRWMMASAANVFHFIDHAESAATAHLPEPAKLWPAPEKMENWGEVFETGVLLIGAAAYQIKTHFAAHPYLSIFEMAAIIWLLVETKLLTNTAIDCFREIKGRFSHNSPSSTRRRSKRSTNNIEC